MQDYGKREVASCILKLLYIYIFLCDNLYSMKVFVRSTHAFLCAVWSCTWTRKILDVGSIHLIALKVRLNMNSNRSPLKYEITINLPTELDKKKSSVRFKVFKIQFK